MAEARTNRRLAAILAADVVGYSRLMGADEAGTLAALKRHREGLFDPTIAAHSGRVVKLIGDGTLVEFASVVDAVNCAIAVQRAIAAEADRPGPRIVLRIGINLGDIIIDGDDIYGDGVNIAARLEPLAEPGGVCVSSIVNESVGARVEAAFADAGEVEVKNINRPIRIWKWHPASADGARPTMAPEAPARKKQTPSIAVLPFSNLSGDPEQEYFSDGISEDIIIDLSKVAGLMVIARNSSFTYKGRAVDIRTVGRDLGVRSVLEGSIRRAGNRVRITAQLIDAATGAHLWAERYDRELTDIFEVQDDVARSIVGALKVTLTPAEEARLSGEGTSSAEAHDCLLRGRELLMQGTKNRDTFERTVGLLKRALELDPGYCDALAALSWIYNLDYFNRWSADPDGSLRLAETCSEKAIAADPNSPFAHYAATLTCLGTGDIERAGREADKALALSPNYAIARNAKGVVSIYKGEAAKAIPDIEAAMRLDPSFSQQYLHFLALAHLLIGNYETAAVLFRERIALVPDTDLSRALLASALGHLGETTEAGRVWDELKAINPKYSFADHMARQGFQKKEDVARIAEGLAKAGLPR
jgi:adenylate cyclase